MPKNHRFSKLIFNVCIASCSPVSFFFKSSSKNKVRSLFAVFLFYTMSVFGDYSIVFVHIGDDIPLYADTAISQARLFNLNARIILLGSRQGLKRFHSEINKDNIELCSYEGLKKTSVHKKYEKLCVEKSAFWRYTSERFLYLWDLMNEYCLENVFHLENDNMLYADLEPMLSYFHKYYPGIGATFDNEKRCIPGFVWIANRNAIKPLAEYFTKEAPNRLSDMEVIGKYRQKHSSKWVDTLPIIMPDYARVYHLESPIGHRTKNPKAYSNHADILNAIFDGAAIGQFLGGIDPTHKNNGPGFINESCLFNPSFLKYEWRLDEEGRAVPYALFNERAYRIINLHVHSKRLTDFRS